MRAQADPNFSAFLLRIGNGEEPTNDADMVTIPNQMLVSHEESFDAEISLINSIYPELQQNAHSSEYLTTRAILATKNDHVDMLKW